MPVFFRLPRVRVPLAHDDPDVVLDLQAAFDRCCEAGLYPKLLPQGYGPPGNLAQGEIWWCRRRVAEAGLG